MYCLQLLDERQEGVDGVAAQENLSKHKAVLDAQGANHRYALSPLVRQLFLHTPLDPYSSRLHPEVEGRLVDVDDIRQGLGHYYLCDPLGELLLGVHQLAFSIHLRPVDYLWFPVGRPMFYVDLPDQPGRERW